jgi:exopolysaccharide biosynthesis polyprenyl glycosylphosphotransferase
MFKQYHRFKLILMGADVIITVGVLALLMKYGGSLPWVEARSGGTAHEWVVYSVVGLLWHGLFAIAGVYDQRKIPDLTSQLGMLTSCHVLAVLMLTGFLYFTFSDISRAVVIYFSIVDYFAMLLLRYAVSLYLKRRRGGLSRARVLIVGTSESAMYLGQTIIAEHAPVSELVGFADEGPPASQWLPAPMIGSIGDVPKLVRDNAVEIVVVAFSEDRGAEARAVVETLESLPVRVYVLPDVLGLALVKSDVERIGQLVVIGVREPVIEGHRRITKRIMDLTLGILVLLVAWPLLLIIWIAVRRDSPGPGIFVAKRVGQNGKIFDLYKFRTMVAGKENAQVEAAKAPTITKEEACGMVYKVEDDPRITRVGRWLRKTSLDELPQLFNVIKGEMSLVGPRPEQPFLTECYDHWQWQRLLVPPGVTGWWQVSGRSDLPMHLNTQFDVYYVRNYSVWLDLKILFKTIGVVLRGKGAY